MDILGASLTHLSQQRIVPALIIDSSSPPPVGGWKKTVDGVARKYQAFRLFKFAVASGVGFLITEAILVLGLFVFYNTAQAPSAAYSSPKLLALNVLAFGIGVTIAFVINERVTITNLGKKRGNPLVRWGKYQLASLLGNLLIVGIQLALLATISLSPAFGNIVGAIVSYPVTYVVSMRFVWKVDLRKDKDG
jgi:putative flippase GtrA